LVVVNVVELNTGTKAKSTKRAFSSSSTSTLHYRTGLVFSAEPIRV
jgi:hypothetical protein